MQKKTKFFKKASTIFVVLTTVFYSLGLPVLPVALAVAPRVMMVEYVSPTVFQVKFDQLMNPATISTASFTLTTAAATDTETISSVTPSDATGKTVVTVVAAGAKISPSAGDYVVVATSGANAPENTATPGEDNADAGMIGFMAQPGQVVISEIKFSGSSETDEFIELYNPTGSAVTVTGWKVTLLAQNGTPVDLVTFGAGNIAAGGFRLVAPTGVANADNYTPGVGGIAANGINANNTIVLYQAIGGGMFRVSDMVGCGTATIKETTAVSVCPSANTSIERKASPSSTTATMDASLSPAGAESAWGNGYDSNNNNFDFVLETAGGVNPQNSLSAVETPGGGGGGYQNQPPTINHMPVFQVISGQQAMFMAMMADPETPPQGLTANLIYSTNNWTGSTTLVGQNISGNDFKFIVPLADTGAGSGTAFKYYLKATDANSNSSCMYNMGMACGASDATAITGSWTVTSISSTGMTNSIKGKVMSGATGINNAMVTLRGAGLTFNTISAADVVDGTFTFANIPAGMFRVEASAPGYSMGWLDGISSKASGAGYTDNTINLAVGGGGGQGGDMTTPRVIWSAPMDGMNGAPTKINIPASGQFDAPIMIGFSKDMDSTTVIAANIKIYPVTSAGLGTALPNVSVAHQAQNSSVTLTDRSDRVISTNEFGPDRKALVYSATALSTNTQYVIDLSSSVKDAAGNTLEGNKSGGGHSISFTTGGDFSAFSPTDMTTGFNSFMTSGGGGGQFTPPYVTGSGPNNGAKNVPTNAKLMVNFSQPMNSVGINATSAVGTYVKLYNATTAQYVTLGSIALDNNTKQTATITVGGSGLTAGSNYTIRVLGGTSSATGVSMAMPGQESNVMYEASFSVGSSTDTGAPTVLGSTIQSYTSSTPCTVNICVTGVPTNVGTMEISFSKDMDASTINSANITLMNGTTSVSTTISYDGLSRSVKIAPTTVLYTVTTYTLAIGTGVKAMNATALAAAYTISFTTNATVDSTGPTVMMANGDDYKLAISFSEPMAAAKATDTVNWASSVLNPANYVLYANNSPPPFVENTNIRKYFTNNTLATAIDAASGGPLTFKYDAAYNTVIIEGLKLLDSSLTIKGGFNIWVQNVKDVSGNVIQDTTKPVGGNVNDFGLNTAGGPVMDARNTFGMIGPGGGGMSGPPPTSALSGGAMNVTAFGGKNPSMMGFMPVNVFPMNMLGGQESMYMIDLPLTTAIPAGGQIILTFPVGFDVTNAVDGDSAKKWAHKDINGPGTGTVVLSSVAANATSRTITVTLGAVLTQATDFLHLEIDRIKNTTKSSDGDMTNGITMGSGYQVDIYTKTASSGGSTTLETLKSMPFFIKSAGTATLTGSITFKNSAGANTAVTLSSLPVYLMSPATGPLKALVDFSASATGTYTFSNLPTGTYMLGSETIATPVSATDYYIDLQPMPQSINVAAGSNTKNLVFQAQSSANKPDLTIYITGTFVNESVDIFAGGPGNFAVKTIALNGAFPNDSPSTQTLYLPSIGTWMVGMGPAMPRGPQQSGPPPMPSWMPPKSIEVNVSGTGPGWTWKDPLGLATGDIANDGKLTIGITTANKTINGHVKNPAGTTGIQNANVFAFSPMGGMGSYAQSGSDGSFTLKVMDGSYQVGAFVPGMPPSQQIPVEVKTVSSTTVIYANGTATTNLIIKIQNPESMYTISGKVTDGTNVIKDASISARRTDAPGNVGGKTDSMGKYILYVQPGTWTVGAFLPQYGNLTEQTVTITTASQANIDFAPATGTTFRTITDRVYKDVNSNDAYDAGTDTLLANVHVDYNKTGYQNGSMTDQNGQYTILVPDGTYTVTAWSPEIGKIPPQTVVVSADISLTGAADLPVADTRTVTVNFVDSLGAPVVLDQVYVQLDKLGSKDVSNETSRKNVSSLTLDVPSGTGYEYVLELAVPGVADSALVMAGGGSTTLTGYDINSDSANDMYKVVVDGNETVNVIVPTLYAVSGQALDNSGNPLTDTVVNIKKAGTNDVSLAIKTDASGNYSVNLPASGATPYILQIDKGGYIDTGLSVVVAGATTQNLDANKASLTISGQIKVGSSGVEGAKVFGKELGGGFTSTETDALGNYSLPVTAGDWKVSAASDGYSEKKYQNASNQDIVVSVATSVPSINVTLATAKTGLAAVNNSDLNPSAGATFDHSSAGLELIAPQNAIASSQATYQMEDYEVANITSSPTAKTIGGEAIQISAYEPSGSSMVPKTSFSSDVTIGKKYTKAELAAEGIDTFAEAENVSMSYFDGSASNWEPVLTNLTYLDALDQPVIPTNTLSNVASVVYAGTSDHLTVYSPTIQSPDGLAPAAPTSASGSATSSAITVSWTAPTTNSDTSSLTDLLGYEVYRSTSSGGTYTQINSSDVAGVSYIDSTVSSGTTYYYKVTAADTGGIESNLSSASSGLSLVVTSGGSYSAPAPSPSPSPSPSVSPTPSPSVSPTPSPSVSPTPSPSVSPTPSPEPSPELELVTIPTLPVNPTTADIQAVITALVHNIMVLQAELLKQQATQSFDVDLYYDYTNETEVKRLQEFLISKGHLAAGLNTGWFGPLTRTAVMAYQTAKGITPVAGYFGPLTRAAANADLGL